MTTTMPDETLLSGDLALVYAVAVWLDATPERITLRSVADECGFGVSKAHKLMRRLVDLGWMVSPPGTRGTWRPTTGP